MSAAITAAISAATAAVAVAVAIAAPVAAIAGIVGVVQGAQATQASADAANAAAAYNARILDENAALADVAAEETLELGVKEENLLRAQTRQFKGRQRAAFATSGALVGSGSTLDVLAGTERISEIDALTIRENALKKARAITRRGTGFKSRAELARAGTVDARAVGATSLLTGIGRLAQNFSTRRRSA